MSWREIANLRGGSAIDVRAFGAVVDGATNDTPAVLAAIEAAKPGDTILFPPGVCMVAGDLPLRPSRTYRGSGSHFGGTTIRLMPGASCTAMLVSEGYANNGTHCDNGVSVLDLVLDGNRSKGSSGTGILMMNWNSLVRDCQIINMSGDGIKIVDKNATGRLIANTSVENRFESLRMLALGGYGIHNADTGNKLTDGYAVDVLVGDAGLDGIRLDRSAGWLVHGCHTYTTGRHGIVAMQCFATTVSCNYVEQFGRSKTPGSTSGVFVHLGSGRGTTVVGNRVSSDELVAGSYYHHLRVDGAGSAETDVTVTGNIVDSTGHDRSVGIRLHAGAGGKLFANVSGNSVHGAAVGVDSGPNAGEVHRLETGTFLRGCKKERQLGEMDRPMSGSIVA